MTMSRRLLLLRRRSFGSLCKAQCIPQHIFRRVFSTSESNQTVILDPTLQARIREFDLRTPHPMNLQQILAVSTNAETIKELNGFLQEEFCIRCAERIGMMEERIPQFAQIPELYQVYQLHVHPQRVLLLTT